MSPARYLNGSTHNRSITERCVIAHDISTFAKSFQGVFIITCLKFIFYTYILLIKKKTHLNCGKQAYLHLVVLVTAIRLPNIMDRVSCVAATIHNSHTIEKYPNFISNFDSQLNECNECNNDLYNCKFKDHTLNI